MAYPTVKAHSLMLDSRCDYASGKNHLLPSSSAHDIAVAFGNQRAHRVHRNVQYIQGGSDYAES